MKVAVLVHNDVVRDARVRKQVATLVAAGFLVDVFGITQKKSTYAPRIEGAKLNIIKDDQINNIKSSKWRNSIIEPIFVFLGLLAVSFVISSSNVTQQIILAIALLLIVLLFTKNFISSYIKIRKARILLYMVLAGLAIMLAGLGVYIGILPLLALPVTGILAWAIGRFRVSRGLKAVLRRTTFTRLARWRYMSGLLSDAVLKGDYDIVHCHDLIALIAGGRIKDRRPNIRMIWDAHEIYEDVASGTEKDKEACRKIIRQNANKIDGFITISESFKDFYSRNYNLPEPVILMNATRYAGHVRYDGRLHAAAGLDSNRRILLFQGGFAPHRGIEALIEAASDLPRGWSIVAMGWGPLKASLDAAAHRLVQQVRPSQAPLVVVPPAPHSELAEWTAGASLGIIPYRNIGLNHLYCTPNKLWEFPNAGVPILATDLVEMSRMIKEWGTGYLLDREFSGRDISQFLAGLDEADLQAKAVNCERFSREMSWEVFQSVLLDIYKKVL